MLNNVVNKESSMFMNGKVKQQGQHMIMTNVYKPTQKKYINIDSRFQDPFQETRQTGLASFMYTLPQIIVDVKSIRVLGLEMCTGFYNFSEDMDNNYIHIGTNKITLSEDQLFSSFGDLLENLNMTISELQAQVGNLEGQDTCVVFTMKSKSKKVSIENQSDSIKTINFHKNKGGTNDFENIKSKLGWALGFRKAVYNLKPGDTIEAEGLFDITPTKYLYLVVEDYLKSNPNSFTSPLLNSLLNKTILARIPIDYRYFNSDYMSVLCFTDKDTLISDTRVYNGKSNLQRMKIELVNEFGKVINMNHMSFSFCLEVEYE